MKCVVLTLPDPFHAGAHSWIRDYKCPWDLISMLLREIILRQGLHSTHQCLCYSTIDSYGNTKPTIESYKQPSIIFTSHEAIHEFHENFHLMKITRYTVALVGFAFFRRILCKCTQLTSITFTV